jgi:hypothetical protein
MGITWNVCISKRYDDENLDLGYDSPLFCVKDFFVFFSKYAIIRKLTNTIY